MTRILFFLALCWASLTTGAQNALFLGVGGTRQADTYLSPLEYRGAALSVMALSQRSLERNTNFVFRTQTLLQYAPLYRHHFLTEHSGDLHFAFGWDRQWKKDHWTMAVGPQAEAHLGGTYNLRNGNNPANARTGVAFGLHARVQVVIPVKRQRLPVDYDLQLPIVGARFAPQYGQSYYNLFEQGRYDHNIAPTHWGNDRSLRQRLTAGFPVGNRQLVVGYLCDLQQQRLHSITQRQFSHSFLIGLSL
ncbi:MAG: DUF3316 domain-containing protein [Bacteroidaceae bacterium]|nr:DUF3316 domain-containing protein [Bacteroidaceae bacterium]